MSLRKSLRLNLMLTATLSIAEAVVANITFQTTPEHCSNADGTIYATVTGGVPPYTYSWSDGPATQGRYDLAAGSYTLTVTDFLGAQQVSTVVIPNLPNWEWDPGSMFAQAIPSCGGPNDLGHVFFGGDMAYAPGGPGPHQFDQPCTEQPFIAGSLPSDWTWFTEWGIILTRCSFGVSGQNYSVNYTDANGCPGYMEAMVPQPPQFYPVTILNIEGACSGAANGHAVFSIPPEPEYIYGARPHLFGPTGQLDDYFENYLAMNWTNGGIYDVPNLAPGTYSIVRKLTIDPNFSSQFPCGDTTYFTIQDLGATCGNVSGTVVVDANTDCLVNGADVRVPEMILEFMPGPYYTTTDALGHYSLNLPLNTYSVTQQTTVLDEHCQPDPIVFNVLGNTVFNLLDTATMAKDLQVTMASGPARPGFELRYAIDIDNLTSASSSGNSLVMTFDSSVGLIGATPSPSSVAGNTITWNNIGNIYYFQHRDFSVRLQVPPDVGLIGSELQASATLTSVGDGNLANNIASTTTTITGSYDPNDKKAMTSSGWSRELYYVDVDQWIDYTIRFQNTGNDTAFTVVVTDTLPSTLIASSVIVGAGSHPFTWELQDSGTLKLYFVNILLPDSAADEAASHGFASFRIRPSDPVLPGTVIENTANIFFDYNPPVITEPSILTAELSTRVGTDSEPTFRIFPNPAHGHLSIVSSQKLVSIRLMSADGRVLEDRPTNNAAIELELDGFGPGLYLLQGRSVEGRVINRSFIKH